MWKSNPVGLGEWACVEAEISELAKAAGGKVSGSNSTEPSILLVDDDAFMLGMQGRMLLSMGYTKLRTAGSAQVALRLIEQAPSSVDVIICDLNMPEMDGIEFLQTLSATAFRGSVILLSGEGARVMHTVQKLLGSSNLVILGALEKPAARNSLRALLECWLPPSDASAARPQLSVDGDQIHTANIQREWVLHYQPKVDLRTGQATGVEALVRWNHPVHGLLYPDSFISVAEDCGAIEGLTNWVVETAMQQMATWQTQDIPLQMAINVSMDNLRAPGFAQRVTAMARHYGVSPQDITFEITESRLMSPTAVPLESLVRLRLQRFGLAIDDFGTGHSSLAQLRDVPFTELKIDRGFVQGARHNQIIRPILDGSIGIAKRLGMKSVAEGVETEDDWHLLRELGCNLAQGFFIGRPMDRDRITQWLVQWEDRRERLTAIEAGVSRM